MSNKIILRKDISGVRILLTDKASLRAIYVGYIIFLDYNHFSGEIFLRKPIQFRSFISVFQDLARCEYLLDYGFTNSETPLIMSNCWFHIRFHLHAIRSIFVEFTLFYEKTKFIFGFLIWKKKVGFQMRKKLALMKLVVWYAVILSQGL